MAGNRCYVPEELGETFYIDTIADTLGADWFYQVPAGYECEVTAWWARITTDATAVTRYPTFVTIRPGDGIELTRVQYLSVGLNSVRFLEGYVGASRTGNALVNAYMVDGVPQGRITAGDRFGTVTLNLQGADTWINIRVLVRRWRI